MSDLIADMQNMVSELIAGAQGPLIAELAALKARRCETCRHYATNDYGYYCESADTPWFEEQPPPNYSCIHWAERTAP